jgi:hypothetical protein
VKVCVLTTSYPRHADDVAGTFVRDGVEALRATAPPTQRLGWPARHCAQLPQNPERQATT